MSILVGIKRVRVPVPIMMLHPLRQCDAIKDFSVSRDAHVIIEMVRKDDPYFKDLLTHQTQL